MFNKHTWLVRCPHTFGHICVHLSWEFKYLFKSFHKCINANYQCKEGRPDLQIFVQLCVIKQLHQLAVLPFSSMRSVCLTFRSTLWKCNFFQKLECCLRPHSRSFRKTRSCSRTRCLSQDKELFPMMLRMGCQSSEMSEPSVTEASTFTFLPPFSFGTPRPCSDCFPTSVSWFKYKLERCQEENTYLWILTSNNNLKDVQIV